MEEVWTQFVGRIPDFYDSGLGPYLFRDYAEDLARRARGLGASSVLELAAGTGIVSRLLRDALPPAARLVVTDLNPPMLAVARGKFRQDEPVEFAPADAMALPYADAEFDLVVCQFGVMFFPDKPASFREAARVLRPGGHYLFNTWGPPPANPFSEVVQGVVERFFPGDPPGFYRVPFSYGDPAMVRDDLAAAGWEELEQQTLHRSRTVADPAVFARGIVYGNPLILEILQRGGAGPGEVERAVLDGLLARFGPAPFTMPQQATVFACRRP